MVGLESFRYINGSAMSEGSEVTITQGLTDIQRRAIVGLADIRRGVQTLGRNLDRFMQSPSIVETPLSLKTTYQQQQDLVTKVMQGDNAHADTTKIPSYLASADNLQNSTPNLGALYLTKAASAQQSSGQDYSDTLARAKECLKRAEEQKIPKTTPADFLPDAYILGIAKQATRNTVLPTPSIVAAATEQDPDILTDYALVLPEEERKSFLAAIPGSKRATVSLQLDKAVSTVLDGALIEEETDVTQREAVKNRTEEAFVNSLKALKVSAPAEIGAEVDVRLEHRSAFRWTSRQLTETLANLGEEDSLRLLKDLSEQTTRELKDLNKDFRKKSDEQRRHALRPAISFTARVLDTLIDTDIRRGGVLAMRYLEMTVLPERLFKYFANKLVAKEYFTKNLSKFLGDKTSIPVLKKLMAQYGPQFNTILDTVSQTPEYTTNQGLATHQTELFEALTDLSTLTPRIFARYRQLPPEQRKNFAERIRVLKPQFFRNTPIKGILGREDRDILTEMVYMAYKPMGMSFGQVEELINKIDDHTDDVSGYNFPEEGYPLTMERLGRYVLKEQQQLDLSSMRQYRNLFTPPEARDPEVKAPSFAEAAQLVMQPQPQEQQIAQALERNQNNLLRTLLEPLAGDDRIRTFLGRYTNITADTAYQAGSELFELTGVYFRDNYPRALTTYFTARPEEFQKLLTIMNDPNTRNAIDQQLRQSNTEVNWQELDAATQPIRGGLLNRFFARSSAAPAETQAVAARIFAQIMEHTQLQPIQKKIKDELSKFTLNTDEISNYRGALKAYVSKNVGSFFAKAAAGICTSQDIPLFERDDHFHINVVENDEVVRANVQAYIEPVNGKPSLVLRGFNPTADWVGKIDIEGFCEQILRIGKQFQQDNGLAALYITEQGGWHALSNRDQVARYLMRKYINDRGTQFPLKVSTEHSIQTIYSVN